jgi:hypothetical protein
MMTFPAVASEFPDRPVKIIVQTAAGSALDVMARLIAEPLSEVWGQPAVIINQAGAGGPVGDDHGGTTARGHEGIKLAYDPQCGQWVSGTDARHSRVKSSTIARMRKRRPSTKASDRKSRLQTGLK